MTHEGATHLVVSVNEHTQHTTPNLPTIQVMLLVDDGPGGTGRFYVSVQINDTEHELGHYDDVNAAAMRMNDFVTGHGYEWARDSARRVDEAQRADAKVLVLDAVPGYKARHGDPEARWW